MSLSPAPTNGARRGPTVSSERLRMLFVAKRFPFPPDTGGKIRTAKLLEQLGHEFAITLVSNVERAKDGPYLADAARVCAEVVAVPWTEVPKYTVRFYADVIRRLWSRYPVSVAGDDSPPFAEQIRTLVRGGGFDVLVCDFVQPSVNLRGLEGPPVLLFQHNVESMIFRRHAETERNPILRTFWRSQWRKMERFEQDACRRFAGVVAVSESDRVEFERFGARRTFAIPTAVDADYFRPAGRAADPRGLVFTGSMDWLPNEDAILFFADEILPRIAARMPGVTLTVVGRQPSARLQRRVARQPAIRLTGRVEDVRPLVAEASVYVVPLRIGGGTRLKLYEAMAMGKAVVSTPVGAEGLPVRDGEHLVLAEEPAAFADAVVTLLEQAQARQRLEAAARGFVETRCSWSTAAAAFAGACRAVAGARA